MVQSDYNSVNPVEGLQNIGTVHAIQPNAERKPRRQPQQRKDAQGHDAEQRSSDSETARNTDDHHSIDFRA